MVCHIIPSAGREKRLPHSLYLVVIHIAEHEREIPEVILRTDEHFYAVKEVKRLHHIVALLVPSQVIVIYDTRERAKRDRHIIHSIAHADSRIDVSYSVARHHAVTKVGLDEHLTYGQLEFRSQLHDTRIDIGCR